MAAVLEKQDPTAKNTSQVDEQIAQATSRIRAHDLTFGGLVLVALLLVYATAMIVLDRSLNLPEWVRQVSLAAFLGVVVATAYLTLVSPLRKRINPLYAAKQVERTIDDAKNSVTGYVDAQQKADLNPTVKAALASKAAKAAAEADVNRAVDHRSLIYLGGASVVLLLTLVVLFFVFRPAQFASLMGRTFVPFSSQVLATQTQLDLVKPEPADFTVTRGQSVTVAVHVNGKVPKADSPEKVRLLIRHNLADPNYDELPMVPGATTRDWELRVPDHLGQNDFWYKVAAGDAITDEHKVTVRSLPMVSDVQVTYEYPKYLRWKNETATTPVIKAPRGTTVTLVAKTNRDVSDGLMVIEPSNARVNGTPVAGKPDSLQFIFKITETGKYKITFNALNGERSADPYQSFITADNDAAPTVVITKPEEDEISVPLNGQIAIDGKIGDDFGIDTVTLKMTIVEPAKLHRELPAVPYLNHKSPSFKREDNTWPTDLDYKGSVDLAKLTKDAAGLPLTLTPDMVIEVWLEATDNCTEPKPNVGRSASKRVRLTPPKVEENEKAKLDEQKQERKNEEKKHEGQQQKKLDKENRPPQKDGQQQPENKPEGGEKKDGGEKKNGDTKKGDESPPSKSGDKVENKTGMGDTPPKKPDDPTMPPDMGMNPPKKEGSKDNEPKKDVGMGMNDPMPKNPDDPNMGKGMPEAPPPKSADDKNLEKKADDLKKELDKENQNGGTAKTNPEPNEAERTDPGKAKPEPKDGMGGMQGMGGNASETKPEPKEPNPNDPMGMGKPENAPASSKPQGDVKKPDEPNAPKPEPKKDGPMGMGQKNSAPASENKSEPIGAPPGGEKEQPKGKQPEPKDPNAKQDPNSGATAKPDSSKKDGDPSGAPNQEKKDPAAEAGSKSKPAPDVNRGGEKSSAPQPKDPMTDKKPEGDPNAGEAKPDKAPPAAGTKPMPKEDRTGKGMDTEPKPAEGANDTMKPNGTNAAESKPDEGKDGKKKPTDGSKPVDKGADKPAPADQMGEKGKGGDNAPMPKQKLDPKEQKELEDATKDLTNPDPKKKEDAQKKLDKAIGEEKRKELEKLANDAQSPDEKTREEAKRKLEKMKEQMKKGQDGKEPEPKEPPKLTEEQKKELTEALDNLQSNDPKKKEEAQKKLDKMIGEGSRKEVEQLMQDLKSDDKDKRDAAQKKLEDLKEKLKKDGQPEPKGKEPTKEEIDDLTKKAQDLQSPDAKTREQAEKELDDKIGKENRQKLQEEMKKKKPMDPKDTEELQKQLKEWRQGRGSSPEAKGPMEEDPKNRLKSAELMLEEFKKNQYNKALRDKQGWTQAEYDKFLKEYEEYVEKLRKDAIAPKAPAPAGPMDPDMLFKGPQGGKVEDTIGGKSGPASRSGATAPAPGFEDARRKFEEALKKKP